MILPHLAHAQMWERLGCDQTVIDTTKTGNLEVDIDAIAFFHDNEYQSDMQQGYTLPGAWVRPAIAYTPLNNIHLELGLSALLFDGANKYPCYAYHDIALWKGNQYQSGAHVLPWFRAQIDYGKTSFILGDIYGNQNHRFATPLYNNEQLLSSDPEMGFQIRHQSRLLFADVFINWQSYQFREDTHQEAFTVGVSSSVGLLSRYDCKQGPQIKMQTIAQHRGGEQDVTSLNLGVQTLWNAAIGFEWSEPEGGFAEIPLHMEANILGCMQQAGQLWDFKSGLAYQAEIGTEVFNDLHIGIGEFYAPKHFGNLYGNAFFSTISIKDGGIDCGGMNTQYINIDYSHTYGKGYTFGAALNAFNVIPKGEKSRFSFAFGAYLRVNPSFLIKSFR